MFYDVLWEGLTFRGVAICAGTAILLGLVIAGVYSYKASVTKSFTATLVMIPVVVMSVIMMVNGNIGTGVAVAGAFSLVRFRSVPGTAKDIVFVFFAMAGGLACGIGQVNFALVSTGLVCVLYIGLRLLNLKVDFSVVEKDLRILVPEDMDFETELVPVLQEFTTSFELIKMKTSNMGSTFSVYYRLRMKVGKKEKEFVDSLRIKNSNLPITLAHSGVEKEEL